MLGNLFGHAYKASRIASTVEPDIMRRMTKLELMSYKKDFSWGTICGNHIFDAAARRARKARLNEADQFILPILHMLEQAFADGNPGMVRCFDRILSEVQPHLINQMSVAVLSESMATQAQINQQLATLEFNTRLEGVVQKAIAEVTADQASKSHREAADALNRRRAQQLDKEEQERRERKKQEREQR